MHRKRILLAVVLLLLSCSLVAGTTFTGKVVGVSDGDTISVTHGKAPEKVRLYGIDCPEKTHDFGTKAEQATSDLVFGKTVSVEVIDTDQYGRSVAVVILAGLNLNQELVRQGGLADQQNVSVCRPARNGG